LFYVGKKKNQVQKNMNKKDEKFMLSKYYCKDKGKIQTNGLFSGKAITKIIIQKKHMKEEIKIIQLRVSKIIKKLDLGSFETSKNLLKSDYFYMKFVLVKMNKNNYEFRWNILGLGMWRKFNKEFPDIILNKELYYYFDYLEQLYSLWSENSFKYVIYVKNLRLNLTKIYNDEDSDFYILQNNLNKLVQAEYKFFKFFKQYILKFTNYLEMESQYFKFRVNKEAKHEVFEKAVLPSVILEDGLKKAQSDQKIDEWLKDRILLLEKQFEDKKALWERKLNYFKQRTDYTNLLVNYFNYNVHFIEIFLANIQYDFVMLKNLCLREIELEYLNFLIWKLQESIKLFSLMLQFYNEYEQYLFIKDLK
jgi:hypothetical protein